MSDQGLSLLADLLLDSPGTYCLLLQCTKRRRIKVGKLGHLDLRSGYYVYVGSAFGPGGVRARLRHHANKSARTHWHIDYLKPHCELCEIWVQYRGRKMETIWARRVCKSDDASIPLPGFGCSDRPSTSHLSYFESRPRWSVLGARSKVEVIRPRLDKVPRSQRSGHRKPENSATTGA